MLPRQTFTVALALLVCPVLVEAQQPDQHQAAAPAYVSYVEGTVSVGRDGRVESSPLNMPLLAGDRITTADGRAEVRFTDGSTLQIDARSAVDLQSDDLLRLEDGR